MSAERAAKLRELASQIRTDANCRDQIAAGFDVIAECMTPCEDCAHDPAPEAAPVAAAEGLDKFSQVIDFPGR